MFLSGGVDPSVKYHSLKIYILTCEEKTRGDSIWWVVLVGRYPWASYYIYIIVSPSRGASRGVHLKTNKKGDHIEQSV